MQWISKSGLMVGAMVLLFFQLLVAPAFAARGAYLGHLTWPEAEQRIKEAPIVIIPFGAGAKEHGPHLPMNADRVVMEYLLDRAVEKQPVVVVPPVLHGWFPAFRSFPGTEISDAQVFEDYMMAVAMSLVRQGAQRIVFLNTGVSKATGLPISIVAREIRVQTGVPTLVVSWDDIETDEIAEFQEQEKGGHADEIETSVNLYLQPGLVRMERAVKDYGDRPTKDYGGYRPGLFARDRSDPGFSDSGVYGDPTLATAEKGKKTLDVMTREWLHALEAFADTPVLREP
jgi:creatinine amidohydrolase